MKLFLCLAAVVALVGCVTRPQVPAGSARLSTNSFADVPGWSEFKEPVENLMRAALTNNCDVSITLSKVDQNRALLRQIEIHPSRTAQ